MLESRCRVAIAVNDNHFRGLQFSRNTLFYLFWVICKLLQIKTEIRLIPFPCHTFEDFAGQAMQAY